MSIGVTKKSNAPYSLIKAAFENKLRLSLKQYGNCKKLNEISSCNSDEVVDMNLNF